MSNDDDGLLRSTRDDRHDVPQLDLPQVGEILEPHVLLRRQPERSNGLGVPASGLARSLRPGHPGRVLDR
jgi:hypothetical protein